MGFPGGSVVKDSPANVGDMSSIPGLRRSPERKWQPTLVFLPGKVHGQRSLVGYSPRGHKESDTTEQSTHIWLCWLLVTAYRMWSLSFSLWYLVKPGPPALGACSLKHQTTGDVLRILCTVFLKQLFYKSAITSKYNIKRINSGIFTSTPSSYSYSHKVSKPCCFSCYLTLYPLPHFISLWPYPTSCSHCSRVLLARLL